VLGVTILLSLRSRVLLRTIGLDTRFQLLYDDVCLDVVNFAKGHLSKAEVGTCLRMTLLQKTGDSLAFKGVILSLVIEPNKVINRLVRLDQPTRHSRRR